MKTIEQTQDDGMLLTAVITDGDVRVGGVGTAHADVDQPMSVVNKDNIQNGTGFVTPEGLYLTRREALMWLIANRPAIYQRLSAATKLNGLESQDYAHAEGVPVDTDEEMKEFMSKQFGSV